MEPMQEENTSCIVGALTRSLPSTGLAQVRYVFCDDPCAALFQGMQSAMPNLQCMALDPTRLAMVYEYATWRKRTAGSKMLRNVLAKFSKVDTSYLPDHWGAPYCGGHVRELNAQEAAFRDKILHGSMHKARAGTILAAIDPEIPFDTRFWTGCLCSDERNEIERLQVLCSNYDCSNREHSISLIVMCNVISQCRS